MKLQAALTSGVSHILYFPPGKFSPQGFAELTVTIPRHGVSIIFLEKLSLMDVVCPLRLLIMICEFEWIEQCSAD